MRVISWPDILVPRDVDWRLDARSKTGGPSLSGITQVVGPPNDIWRAELTFPSAGQESMRTFRALQMQMSGRQTAVWLKVWDHFAWDSLTAWGVDVGTTKVPFSDGALFSDGAGFAPISLTVPLAIAAAQGDVQITLDSSALVSQVPAGVFVSIGGWLHHVVEAGMPSGGQVVLRIRPGLRAAAAVSAEVNFEPRVLVRFATDDTGRLQLNYGRWAEPTVLVEEVMNRDGLSL